MPNKGSFQTDEVKKKISKNHRTYQTEETKKKLSDLRRGKPNPKLSIAKTGKHYPKISIALKGHVVSEEARKKMSIANIGRLSSEETRKKLSDSHKGIPRTEEQKRKLSETRKRLFAEGKLSITEETRNKQSESHMGEKSYNFGKRGVLAVNWKGGRRLSNIRQYSKRKMLGYDTVNEPFDGSDGHHIDREHVVYVPKKIHKSVYHRLDRPDTMDRVNTKVYCWLLGFGEEKVSLLKD